MREEAERQAVVTNTRVAARKDSAVRTVPGNSQSPGRATSAWFKSLRGPGAAAGAYGVGGN